MRFRRTLALLTVFSFLLISPMAYAQATAGSMSGTVLDPSGYAIPGAQVVITHQGTNRQFTTMSGPAGGFTVTSLPIGVYTVKVTFPGFKSFEATDVRVETAKQYSLSVKLDIGAVSETLTVVAGTDLIQTTNAEVSTTVEGQQMKNLPLLDRDPLILLSLQAGVNANPEITTVVNGQRSSGTNITLDGINIQDNFIRSNTTDFIPVRLTQTSAAEFTVTNQNASSSQGLGSSQVSFTTPGGGNEWHGDVYWYHRNNKFAANDWFNNASGTEKEQLVQNQGGFSIGGPVVKDKLFIWGNYELLRIAEKDTQNTTILTSSARQGIFTYNATCGGATTPACPAGIVNGQQLTLDLMAAMGTTIDPFIATLLADVPTVGNNSLVGDGINRTGFRFNQSADTEDDAFTVRGDWNPSDAHNVSATWKRQDRQNDRPDIDNTFNVKPVVFNDTARDFLSTNYRWSPSSSFTNSARFGFVLSTVPFNTNETFAAAGLPGGVGVLANLEFTNPIEDFRFQGRNTDTYSFQNNASYIWGNHNIAFGFQFQAIRVNSFTGFNVIPTYTIGTSVNSGLSVSSSLFPGGISGSARGLAEDLHETLAGLISGVTQEFNVTSQTSGFVPGALEDRNFELDTYSLYVNDSWRVHPRLNLTLGLRWEYLAPLKERDGLFLRSVLSEETTADAVAALNDQFRPIDFAPQPLYGRDFLQFAPQAGFAWDIFGDGKTSFRSGFSLSYINDEGIRAADNAASGTPGLVTNAGLSQTVFSISGGNQPAATAVPTPTFTLPRTLADNAAEAGGPATVFLIDPEYRTPYFMQWNLGIQREIGWNTAVEVRYVGTRGVKLGRAIDFNQVGIDNLLSDFQILQANGFNFQALTGSFDATCGGGVTVDTSVAGCTATSGAWDQLPNFGFLFVGFVGDFVRTGQIGELLAILHFNDLCGSVQCVPNPQAGVADMLTNLATSDYHGGVIEVRRNFSDGLFFQANYTFSKILTDFGGEGQANFEPFLDLDQPDRDRARANFDITHAFKTNFNYELPMGDGHSFNPDNGVLNKLVSGWGINSIFTWQTGTPISLRTGRGTLNRAGRCRNRCSPDSTLTAGELAGFFGIQRNPANGEIIFVDPALINTANNNRGIVDDASLACVPFGPAGLCNPRSGALGNLPLNFIDTPMFFNWNFSISKNTAITEGTGLEFRAEFFNFTNHPTFDVDSAEMNINSTNFGKPNNVLSQNRVMQLSLRFFF